MNPTDWYYTSDRQTAYRIDDYGRYWCYDKRLRDSLSVVDRSIVPSWIIKELNKSFATVNITSTRQDSYDRLWVDRERLPEDDYTLHAKSFEEAVTMLSSNKVTKISIGYDIGKDLLIDKNGFDLCKYIRDGAKLKTLPETEIELHDINPKPKELMEIVIREAEEFWKKRKK